jgi:hypothetical protein
VIGGGFAAAGDFILDPAREVVAREGLAHAGEQRAPSCAPSWGRPPG